MKKVSLILLAVIVLTTLCSCGGNSTNKKPVQPMPEIEKTEEQADYDREKQWELIQQREALKNPATISDPTEYLKEFGKFVEISEEYAQECIKSPNEDSLASFLLGLVHWMTPTNVEFSSPVEKEDFDAKLEECYNRFMNAHTRVEQANTNKTK